MIKTMKRLGALALGILVVAGSSTLTFAQERSYTYNYDYWEDVQASPDAYTAVNVFLGKDLGLDKPLMMPEGLYVKDETLYICDGGNNRIVELKRTAIDKFELVRIIDEIKGSDVKTFLNPTDVAVDEDGYLYIADMGNGRVVKLDQDLNLQLEFVKPEGSVLDEKLEFQPSKIAVDTAGRLYCVALGVNKGLIKYENDGVYSGFVGAPKATYNWADYIWKKIASQAQREQMVSFVPTEYDNLYMDYEGFVYACAASADEEGLDSGQVDAVRRLNLMGNDILVRNGDLPIFGDIYWGNGGGHEGPSLFADVTAMDNDVFVCLDKNRGRLFGYDDQGHLMFAFGSNGNMDGYFNRPSALEHMGYDLLVLDSLDNSLTVFTPTEFGRLVYEAMDQFDEGDYEASGKSWEEIMKINGNYDLAYIGIGRSLLRQERYQEAMEYFELKYDEDNYSKAYKQYRKEWVEQNIGWLVAILLLVFLVPMAIGKVKSIKHEIDMADIFRR